MKKNATLRHVPVVWAAQHEFTRKKQKHYICGGELRGGFGANYGLLHKELIKNILSDKDIPLKVYKAITLEAVKGKYQDAS